MQKFKREEIVRLNESGLTGEEYSFTLLMSIGSKIREDRGETFGATATEGNLIMSLFQYFTRKEECPLDLQRGLLLIGEPGCGKTSILTIFREWLSCWQLGFRIDHASQVANAYTSKGPEGVLLWTMNNNHLYATNKPITLMIDDIGRESIPAMHFGSKLNVIKHVLELRYQIWQSDKSVQTYMTTNYTLDELGKMYDVHVMDRMKDMFNIIRISGGSHRQEKKFEF